MTFTAPKTYTEAKALMGQDVETPIGMLHCTSAGLSGVAGTPTEKFGIHFHGTKGNVGISWDSVNGWVTDNERKAKVWTAEWDKLPKMARTQITLVVGDELFNLPTERRNNVNKILRIAKRRLIKAGKLVLKTCSRCGGGGHYSYCEMHGTTCFGCGGSGKVLPSTGEALKAAKAK